ncbi:MAG: sigma-54-dependent Fis family transcriptional regulator [Bryobacterales bacterium]|nr:sigma-54-dependent Fis family transcriptional regulator [Bryobacterales bacterium]
MTRAKPVLLIVEDERTALRALKLILEDEGYSVLEAACGEDGLRLALSEQPELILLDIRLPDIDGLTVLQRLRAGHSDAAVIIMTAETSSANAIRATQYGAFDYLSKPIHDEHLLLLIRRALEYRQLEIEVRSLRTGGTSAEAGVPGMVGHTPAMQEVYKTIGRVADSAATVLVTGESGTGKELVANALHQFSGRRGRPLVKVNCAAIPGELLEAELFGHEKGAFTNAVSRRIGRFEQAEGGILFLDEVGDMPLALQAKLLRAVQERTIERLGSNAPIPVDFRLVAATARDLSTAVAEGRFREDLYYRLNVVVIALPPLRDRREDIPLLVQRFLARSERPVTIRQDALDKILNHDWPGNVRELENVITRAVVLAPGGIVTPEVIEFPTLPSATAGARCSFWESQVPYRDGYWAVLRRVESALVKAALREAGGNKTEAARILGVQRRLLYQKMAELGI